jgi:hypothetical protein
VPALQQLRKSLQFTLLLLLILSFRPSPLPAEVDDAEALSKDSELIPWEESDVDEKFGESARIDEES